MSTTTKAVHEDGVAATRAAIIEAEKKVEAFLQAADAAVDALQKIHELDFESNLSSAVAFWAAVDNVKDYIEYEGNGSNFDLNLAEEHVKELRPLFDLLVG
jgi:hypothetical protein